MGKKKLDASPPERNRRNKYHGVDPLVVSIACKEARMTIGKNGFKEDDLPDLEQELIIVGLRAVMNYDSVKGHPGALIKTAVRRHLINLHRYRLSKNRNWRLTSSLNQETVIDGEEVYELIDQLPERGYFGPVTSDQLTPFERKFRIQVIREALARLPPELKDLCRDLQEMSVPEIANKRKISDKVIYAKIARIRRMLAGMIDEKQTERNEYE